MRIRLFGEVSAATDAGQRLDVGPAKCQAVLAALALSARSAVPVSRLAEIVWGAEPPRTADKTLQSYVALLRKGLGHESIVRTGTAYRLEVPVVAVDVARFRQHLASGDVDAALAEWTGTPLAGLDVPGLTATVDALVEQWLGAVESSLERRVETDASAVIGPLTELTARHPFREGLWALLMTALYRAGRQADALAAFHTVRGHLIEQLGVEPGPRLREVESLILRQSEHLAGTGEVGSGSGRPTGTVTFGFCQVEGSTRLWATHGQKAAEAMARLGALVRATAQNHRGFVFADDGESFGVAFHRADDAAAWAVELRTRVSSEPWPGGVELRLRAGLHTGETDERAKRYFGTAVSTASRLASAGHGGQTLVSAVTWALLDRDDLRDLGTHHLDGVTAEHRLYQLDDAEHPPLRVQDVRRGNLPLPPDRLIGRTADVWAVVEALAASPVVTLVGPGGIGKTRLALAGAQSADDDRGGAWWVELAEIASSSDVPRAVADVLNVAENPGRTLTESVVAALRSRPVLLVLDSCEHVIAGAAELAHAITEGCPGARVLATSREALGVSGEQLIAVTPLDPAGPAVELFNERALAASRTFDAQAGRADIEEICRRLDGLPLAIELAAARTRTLTPADLVERLGERLRLLTRGRRASAERHQTLRATIRWSFDLLTSPQQVLFSRLSAFVGPFDLAAAGSVAADADLEPGDLEDLLEDLVEQSMLVVESGSSGRRFRLLETMREFGSEQLAEAGSTDVIAARHSQWCLDEVTHIHGLLTGQGEIEGVAHLSELWPHLRAAFDRACTAADRDVADALVRPIVAEVTLRRQSEIGDWSERILALTAPQDEELVVFWLTWATHRYMHTGDRDAYEDLLDRYGRPDHPLISYTRAYLYEDSEALNMESPIAVAMLRAQGDDHLAALTELAGVGSGLMSTGRLEEFDALILTLAARYRTKGPPTFLHLSLLGLGYSALFQGKQAQADAFFAELADLEVPDRTFPVNMPGEARAAFRRGNRTQAFEILNAHIDTLLETDNMDVARLACVEFITMMATIDRLTDAARVMGYLDTTGGFGTLASTTIVADAAARIPAPAEGSARQDREVGSELDARGALLYMRDVLTELVDR